MFVLVFVALIPVSFSLTAKTYYIYNGDYEWTWNAARAVCEKAGFRLAMIENEASLDALIAYIKPKGNKQIDSHFWIGLNKEPTKDSAFRWDHCEKLNENFINWKAGNPQNPEDAHCAFAELDEKLSWKSDPCTNKHRFVCEDSHGLCNYATDESSCFQFEYPPSWKNLPEPEPESDSDSVPGPIDCSLYTSTTKTTITIPTSETSVTTTTTPVKSATSVSTNTTITTPVTSATATTTLATSATFRTTSLPSAAVRVKPASTISNTATVKYAYSTRTITTPTTSTAGRSTTRRSKTSAINTASTTNSSTITSSLFSTTASPTTSHYTIVSQTSVSPNTPSRETTSPKTTSSTTSYSKTASPATASHNTASPTVSPTTPSPKTASPTTPSHNAASPTTASPNTASPTASYSKTDSPTTLPFSNTETQIPVSTSLYVHTLPSTSVTKSESTSRFINSGSTAIVPQIHPMTTSANISGTTGSSKAEQLSTKEALVSPVTSSSKTASHISARETCGCYMCLPVSGQSEIQRLVNDLVELMRVDKSKLSSTRRKHESAADERLSAKVLGVSGIVFIFMWFSLFVLADVMRLCKYLERQNKPRTGGLKGV